jgi:hypothetical protein
LGCTPGNDPSNTTALVINAETKNYANIGGITSSDEVWFNPGDGRYYTGSSAAIGGEGQTHGATPSRSRMSHGWLRLRSSGVLMPIAAKGRQRPTNR